MQFPHRFAAMLLGASTAMAGCHINAHPDDQAAVYQALDQNNLRSVMVSQDRGAGVITLSGIVGSNDRKTQAEKAVRQAAPGYTISDQLRIDNSGVLGMLHHPSNTPPPQARTVPKK